MKYKKIDLLCFFMLIPFFKSPYLSSMLIIEKIIQMIFIFSIIIIGCIYLSQKKKPSKIFVLITIMQVWILIITIVNAGPISIAFKKFRYIVLIALICDLFSNRIGSLIKCLMLHFELNIYINLLTVILYPSGFYSRINEAYGMTTEWFLGARNNFTIWLFPGLIVAWIFKEYFKRNKRCYLLTVCIILTELLQGSGTAIVGITLFITCILFKLSKKIFTPLKSMIIAMVTFTTIILFRNFEFLEPIIVGVLGKSMTFSSRLDIWDNAILAINNKLTTGYGILSTNDTINILGNMKTYIWKGATHAHCHILQVLFQGGIIAFLILIYIYYIDLKRCSKLWSNRVAQIFTFGIFAYSIMGITEVFEYPLMYLILLLPYYSYEIINQSKISENNILNKKFKIK